MKAFPVVVLVLLAFAAFFLSFLLAPLAVLLLFYVIFAMGPGRREPAPAPAPLHESEHPWEVSRSEAAIDDEEAPPPAPARRARITVVSRTDRMVVEPAADAPAVDEPQAGGSMMPQTPRAT